jgi:8-oxo-dGTP diphosphatase
LTGETTEEALQREVQEEIGTNTLHSVRLIGVYSHPDRDDRRHTISAAYVGRVYGRLKAGDDAKSISVIPLKVMNVELIKLGFDHGDILRSYWYDRNQSRTVLAPKRGTSTCPAPYPVDS